MKILSKILLYSILVLVIIASSIWIYLHYQSPSYEGVNEDLNLDQKVEVFFDNYGIPHIYAENKKDAYKVMGYLHAQDRLFQMDLMRRVGAGRLSEIFGGDLIKADQFYRTLGIGRNAQDQLEDIQNRIKGSEIELICNAYLEGVNRYIDEGVWPVEYRVLGISPEKFTLLNMMETAGYMAFSFAFTLKTEPAVDFVLRELPDSTYWKGMDIYFEHGHLAIPVHRQADSLIAQLSVEVDNMMNSLPIPILQGSNAWVLSPERSESGNVLFANDTHIKFSQPAVWYESHIETPGFSFYGNFLPGIPFALVGHNKKIAWGLTMFENDDADLYSETLDSTQNSYLFDGEWKDLVVHEEIIKVKSSNDQIYQVRETQNGPIISDFLETPSQNPISYWWTYLKFDNTLLDAFYQMNNASNLKDAQNAASLIAAPGLNVNYGDHEGNIAWWAAAKMVRRPKGMQSMMIHDGSDPNEQLTEYWDFNDNPHSINPPSGYIYSANNQTGMMPDSSFYPGYYAPHNRAKRIAQMIESKDQWNIEEMKMMSRDVTSVVESGLCKTMTSYVDIEGFSENEKDALEWLSEWDGNHNSDEGRAILYYRWIQLLIPEVYLDEFGPDFYQSFISAHRLKRSYPIVFSDEKSIWWDNVNTDEIESANELCTKTFKNALSKSTSYWGMNRSKWEWGKAHQLYFEHPLGKVNALKGLFNVGPFEAPGGNETVNNAGIKLTSESKVNLAQFGPQMRILIDFEDVEHSISINPTGQSGNFMSEHYDDQASMFVNGKFRKQLMDKEIISKGRRMVFNSKQN